MKTTCDGIVIWEVKTGEADRVITILTEKGIITAYARSSLKPGSKLTGGTAMLSYSNFELSSGKNMFTVVEASSHNRFLKIFSDVETYSLVIYFCELMKYLAPEDDDCQDYLKLMLNCLFLLDSDTKPLWQVKAVFELTIMTLSGYMPDLHFCSICGKQEINGPVFFDVLEATFICDKCISKTNKIRNTSLSVFKAMRYVISSDPRKAFSFSLNEESSKEFSQKCEDYVLAHLERKPKSLEFYNRIKTN